MTARVRIESRETRLEGASNARASWSARRSHLVTVEDDVAFGQGEAAPLPGYGADDEERCERELARIRASDLPFDAQDATAVIARVEELAITSPAAHCAIETALLDFVGRKRGLPVHALFGPPRASSIPISALLSADDLVASASKAAARGILVMKMKIGRDLDAEVLALSRIRLAFPRFELRLDANGALPLADVSAVLQRFVDSHPSYVEEPCELFREPTPPRCPVPIAIDESLARTDDAWLEGMLASGRVAALVLKPMALGGIGRCLRLAERAHRHRVPATTSHMFDGPIGRAVAAELALMLPHPLAAGVDVHGGLVAWPDVVPASIRGAVIASHHEPGLGMPRLPLRGA